MIFTKMFRGMSLGTTPRDPLGKSVVMMVIRRLKDKGGRENKGDWLSSSSSREHADVSSYLGSRENSEKENKPLHPFISIITLCKVFLGN